jgi:hypothetical protein
MRSAERFSLLTNLFRQALDGRQTSIWTAMPGIIASFDPAKMTCSVDIAITIKRQLPDESWQSLQIPTLLDCPVIFPSGGGYTLTFPITVGDECLVIFANRCIDAWWQNGGVQPQWEFRMHDLSDGFVLPGPHSQPRALANVSTTNTEFRSDDGAVKVALQHSDNSVRITAPGGVWMNSKRVDDTHTHGGVTPGGGNTNVPN